MITKKAIKDKYRDTKKVLSKNWKLYKRSKLGIVGIFIIIFFVVMAAAAPLLTNRDPVRWNAPYEDMVDATQIWEKEDWVLSGPTKINGELAPSGKTYQTPSMGSRDTGMYAVGDDEEGETNLYWLRPSVETSPYNMKMNLDGNGTSTPQVYPETEDAPEYGSWAERVYTGTDKGILYRAIPNDDRTGLTSEWTFDLSTELGEDVSITNTPEVGEIEENGEDYLYVIVTTEDSMYAIRDTRSDSSEPEIVWSQNFGNVFSNQTDYALNQPVIFKNPRGEGLRDTKTLGLTTDNGELIYVDYKDGDILWNFNVEDVADKEVKLSPPVIPLSLKKGDQKEQFFYTSGDDGRIYIIPNNETLAPEDLGEDNIADVEKDAALSVPEVRANGKGIWIISNKQDGGTVHYIDTDELTTEPDAREYSWSFPLDSKGVGKPFFYSDKRYVYVATEDNQIYCFDNSAGKQEELLAWTVNVGGDPRQVFIFNSIIDESMPLVVIHSEESGGVEGWEASGEFKAPLPPGTGKSGTQYLLGTDNLGRDIFSQLVYGTRIALLVGFAAAFFAVFLGTAVGITAGYLGGGVDIVLMRLVDVFLCMPSLALMIVFIALLGTSIWNIVFVIGIIGWPGIARVIRAQTLSLKERPFVDSARVSGASKARIMFRHIAPNVMPLTLLYMTFQVTGAILSEASLSFIGLGDPTSTSWGQMLYTLTRGSGSTFTAWWWFFPPGLSITLLVLGFFFVSRAFDEIINPRLRERR